MQLTARELLAIFSHRPAILFLLLVGLAYTGLDAYRLQESVGAIRSAAIWAVSIAVYVLIYSGLCVALAFVQKWTGLGRVYLPLVGAATFLIVVQLTVFQLALYSGTRYAPFTDLLAIGQAFVIIQVFEALYFAYVFPILRERLRPAPEKKEEEVEERLIESAGQSFDLGNVLCMVSQEHHVHIATADGGHKIRARLGDLVSQTRADEGVQLHRSHWAARHAIAGIEKDGANDVLVLVNGERLPIARPRRGEVREWLSQYRPDIDQTAGDSLPADARS